MIFLDPRVVHHEMEEEGIEAFERRSSELPKTVRFQTSQGLATIDFQI
jgi:hypothetical protein